MKRQWTAGAVILLVLVFAGTATAGGWRFAYRLKPGQEWIVNHAGQTETNVMGQKQVHRNKTVIGYKISTGPKKGWVRLTAKILSAGGGMDLKKMTFTGDMHTSGEIRNKQVTGSAAPQMEGMEGMTPEMKAMMAQSYRFMADAWKEMVFWFPEFPEEKLDIGDEFDMTRKMAGGGGAMGMTSVRKEVYTLEDVSDGLAYFSVKDRSVTQTQGAMGGKAKTKTAGKGETVFDLQDGMWMDVVSRFKSATDMGAMPGMPGAGSGKFESLHINKITVEQK